MPASMMSDDSGSRPKLIGKSIPMVGIGPMPGSTPISVPSRHPSRAKPRFLSDTAAPKPVARFWSRSNSILAAPPRRQWLPQQVDEHHDSEYRQAHAEQDRFAQLDLGPGIGGENRQQDGREREADRFDQEPEDQDRGDDEGDGAQLHRLDRRSLHRHPPEPEDQPDRDDQSAEQDGEVTRTHARGGAEGEIGTEVKPDDTDEREHQARPEILRTPHPQHAVPPMTLCMNSCQRPRL